MQRKRGFTLIELLVVISIISLLASIVLASLNSARDKGRTGAGRQFEANIYHVAADQAIGIWDFEDCSGTSLADRSGNGNNGTITGSSPWSTDTFSGKGCALTLDGSTKYVSVSHTSSMDITADITMSAWVKKQGVPSNQYLISKDNGGAWDYLFFFSWLGPTKLWLYVGTGDPMERLSSTATITDNNWHHVAVSRGGSVIKFYIDGKDAGTATTSLTLIGANNYNLGLGASSTGTNKFNGSLDSVRIYAKTLTANEISKQYAEGLKAHPLVTNI